jgi:hypothetical protein
MIDASAYPRPVPLSQDDAVALARDPGAWPDVPGTFLVYVMIPVASRFGEWRFAGAARSLAVTFECLAWFAEAFGLEPGAARDSVLDLLGAEVLEVKSRLEDGWSGPLPYFKGVRAHRVVYFGEGGEPHDHFGVCILEVEPEDGEPFFARRPETHPPSWEEYLQKEAQQQAEEAAGWSD